MATAVANTNVKVWAFSNKIAHKKNCASKTSVFFAEKKLYPLVKKCLHVYNHARNIEA